MLQAKCEISHCDTMPENFRQCITMIDRNFYNIENIGQPFSYELKPFIQDSWLSWIKVLSS